MYCLSDEDQAGEFFRQKMPLLHPERVFTDQQVRELFQLYTQYSLRNHRQLRRILGGRHYPGLWTNPERSRFAVQAEGGEEFQRLLHGHPCIIRNGVRQVRQA